MSHAPPAVLFPTPPTTTAPKARHDDVELQTLLYVPPPINELIPWVMFKSPPTIAERKPEAVLLHPLPTNV
jgi:hypothetical protein